METIYADRSLQYLSLCIENEKKKKNIALKIYSPWKVVEKSLNMVKVLEIWTPEKCAVC